MKKKKSAKIIQLKRTEVDEFCCNHFTEGAPYNKINVIKKLSK